MTNKPFSKIIGQKSIVQRLIFSLEARESGRVCPHFLFSGFFGGGKTALMREFAKSIVGEDGKPQKYFEINCSSIKSADHFFEQVWMPKCFDRNVTLGLEEFHAIPKNLANIFLTMLNTEKSHIRKVAVGDSEIEVDFSRQIILAGTTEIDKIGKPLRSRFDVLGLESYKNEDLTKIIKLNSSNIKYDKGVLENIADSIKGTPRSAVSMANKICDYCSIKKKETFDEADFKKLSAMADIKKFGLDNTEVAILNLLNERHEASLNEICATLGLSRGAVMGDHEHQLLKKALIKIDGKRIITAKGKEIAKLFKVI